MTSPSREEAPKFTKDNDDLPRISRDPFPHYHAMRSDQPVHYDPDMPWWEIFRYEDVRRTIADPVTFPTSPLSEDPTDPELPIRNVINTDPPAHTRLRHLMELVVNEEQAQLVTPRIRAVVDKLLDKVATQGQMDLVKDFSYDLPLLVIADLLNLPEAEHADFVALTTAFLETSQQVDKGPVKKLAHFFRDLVAKRRLQPQDDMLSTLMAAEIDGDRLNDEELVSFGVVFVNAGAKSISNLISSTVMALDTYPAVIAEVEKDHSLIPSMVEETLRFFSPVQMLPRITAHETQIGEQEIKAGEVIAMWIGSAHRDETVFADPDTYDVRRCPNPHFAFGAGIHLCLGAPLARREAIVALQALFERFTNIKRVKDVPIELFSSPFIYGIQSLPITFRQK